MLTSTEIIKLYQNTHHNYSNITFIPFDSFGNYQSKCYQWFANQVKNVLECEVILCMWQKQMIIYKEDNCMDFYKITIDIPYNKRDEYIKAVTELNAVVSRNGSCTLFVCNIPYCLKSYLCIEDDMENLHFANDIIDKYSLKKVTKFGLDELIQDIQYRQYNAVQILPDSDIEEVASCFSMAYIFKSELELENNGFSYVKQAIRKNIFISYCHNDKQLVYEITDALENSGLNLWIDKKDINVGDNLLMSILMGIQQSDFAILFISNSTKHSNFSKAELENIMTEMIRKNLNWYVVKIDDINVDDVLPLLSNYKYFELTPQNHEELIEDIKLRISKIV